MTLSIRCPTYLCRFAFLRIFDAMTRGRSDLAALLTLMGEAHDLDEPEPFTPLLLDRVADSLGCEYASYYELDITTGDVPVYVRSLYEEALATCSGSSTSHRS